MILTNDGKVVEAGPGISGTLIVGEGCQITEDEARKHGLMPSVQDTPKQKPMVEPIIVRGPEGRVVLDSKGVSLEESPKPPDKPPEPALAQTGDVGTKPWEAPAQSPTTSPIDESGKALNLNE